MNWLSLLIAVHFIGMFLFYVGFVIAVKSQGKNTPKRKLIAILIAGLPYSFIWEIVVIWDVWDELYWRYLR